MTQNFRSINRKMIASTPKTLSIRAGFRGRMRAGTEVGRMDFDGFDRN